MENLVRISRLLSVAAVCSAAALVLSSVPVQATSLSGSTVGQAYSVMLSAKDARSAGISKAHMSNFDVANSTKGTPDAPWLCDLSGANEVEGKGAANLLSSGFINLAGEDVTSLTQEIHWYSSTKAAKKAYDGIVKLIKTCEGQQTPSNDDTDPVLFTITHSLTNGTGKAKDGDPYVWVKSETVTSDPTNNFADHDYMTVRHFGSFIQIMSMDSEGTNAPPLTAKQLAAVNRLTDSLGDSWQATFM